jgi:cytochrome c peroxidase
MHRSLAAAAASALALACGDAPEPRATEAPPAPAEGPAEPAAAPAGPDPAAIRARARAIFGDLPDEAVSPDNPITEAKITLGRMLYFDPRLSTSQEISCNTCHPLDRYGADGEPTSPGHLGQRGTRNSPSVYNAALHIAQFWDGRAKNVEEQAKGPVLNPIEMAMPAEPVVVEVLGSIPDYAEAFAAAFPGEAEPITYDNMALAIGAFERRLITPSRFDAFLEGRDDALTEAEVEGLDRFIALGCIQCHLGPAVGGASFQKLGRAEPYPTEDLGRYEITKQESDRFVFKVPSLRNVEKTGPWFHDGGVDSLDEAIRRMGRYQLGVSFSDEEVASLRAFFDSLTGEVDAVYTAPPELPPQASAEGARSEPKASEGGPPQGSDPS